MAHSSGGVHPAVDRETEYGWGEGSSTQPDLALWYRRTASLSIMATPLLSHLRAPAGQVGVTSLGSLAQEAVSAQSFTFYHLSMLFPIGSPYPVPISLLERILCNEEIVVSEKYWFKS